jgi:hypothetical protein
VALADLGVVAARPRGSSSRQHGLGISESLGDRKCSNSGCRPVTVEHRTARAARLGCAAIVDDPVIVIDRPCRWPMTRTLCGTFPHGLCRRMATATCALPAERRADFRFCTAMYGHVRFAQDPKRRLTPWVGWKSVTYALRRRCRSLGAAPQTLSRSGSGSR